MDYLKLNLKKKLNLEIFETIILNELLYMDYLIKFDCFEYFEIFFFFWAKDENFILILVTGNYEHSWLIRNIESIFSQPRIGAQIN